MRLRDSIYVGVFAIFIRDVGAFKTPIAKGHGDIGLEANAVHGQIPDQGTRSDVRVQRHHRHRILTYIVPSPGASPVAVTRESQIVTSYVPQFTLCELPPIAEISVAPPPLSAPSTAPYRNYSVSIPTGTGTCTTIFSPTITMVCATTLTALDKQYTVTDCNEDITFSSQYGYSLESATLAPTSGNYSNPVATITSTPSIVTLTTFMLAPWQQLTAGTAPAAVDLKICKTSAVNETECVLQQEVWETRLATSTATSMTTINISTTIHGSSQILVESFTANVTEYVTTFSMSTTMALAYETEYTITDAANRTTVSTVPTSTLVPATSNVATHTRTITLEEASGHSSVVPSAMPTAFETRSTSTPIMKSSSADVTTTYTTHVTSTVHVGTMTVTVQGASK